MAISKNLFEQAYNKDYKKDKKPGAGSRNRTRDLLITNQLLYQLSYASKKGGRIIPLEDKLSTQIKAQIK